MRAPHSHPHSPQAAPPSFTTRSSRPSRASSCSIPRCRAGSTTRRSQYHVSCRAPNAWQAILPQGRTKWLNPSPPKEETEEENDDEEAKDDAPEPEVGPPLLHPLQNDDRACLSMRRVA